MKSHEVLKLLKITRATLTAYVKSGKIKVSVLPNGYYDYHEESVNTFVNKPLEQPRYNIIYCRVSTYNQRQDLGNQILEVVEYCNLNNIKYDKVYQEIASGITFDRKEFSTILHDVINKKINNIYITYKDRLSRLSFITLENIFKLFGTNIIVINQKKEHNAEDDLFEELISIIHIFSTKIYSHRRKNTLKRCKKALIKYNLPL